MRLAKLAGVPLLSLALLVPGTQAALAATPGYALTKTTTGQVIRWNPCAPIHYRVNLAHAPKGALKDVKAAVARVHKATGITFVYLGTTSVVPQAGYGTTAPAGKWLPVVIAWAAPGKGKGKSTALQVGEAGVGGPAFASWYGANGDLHPLQAVSGTVVLNDQDNARYKPGFGAGETRGEVLLHELGHVMGLQHVSDPRQLMYPVAIPRTKAEYGKGDLAGLKKVGRAAGCIKVKPFNG